MLPPTKDLEAAIERANCYVDAGADMIFAEALTEADHFRQFASSVSAPILANMTEFGNSPLLSVDELRELGIQLILYPLTAFRVDERSRRIDLQPPTRERNSKRRR